VADIQPVSDADWNAALAAVGPEPVECLRCGRWLHNRLSILRKFGPSCFIQQALETISNAPYPPLKLTTRQTVKIVPTESKTRFLVHDLAGQQVGEIVANERGTWNIYAFGKYVDLDANFESAKRRTQRIFSGLWS
jgi:Family of unknown function (DUF6011)